jgi:hypothetical protein
MTGVLLRCATCGTTQSHAGECDACSEGEVRYFCSNHSPGVWLDEAVCQACGAKFGDAPTTPEPTPRTRPAVTARETRRPQSRPPKTRGAEPRRTGLRKPPPSLEDPEAPPAALCLADLLAGIAEERARDRVEEVRAEPTGEGPRTLFAVRGCLVRLVLFVLVLIALVLGGLFLLFGVFSQFMV